MQNFQPDCGKIEVYRSAGGFGIRLDGGAGYQGSIITPHYDSLLVKVTAKGTTYRQAIQRLLRGLSEFRIRGVRTNIPFLLQLLIHPTFQNGRLWTTFIDDTPALFEFSLSQNRAQKLLYYLGELVVNGSQIQGQMGKPGKLIPHMSVLEGMTQEEMEIPCKLGWRNIYLQAGPEGVVKALLSHKGCLITDTTWRDAHQSLLMTRMRTYGMLFSSAVFFCGSMSRIYKSCT
jgi:pyruvate carboxylase